MAAPGIARPDPAPVAPLRLVDTPQSVPEMVVAYAAML